MGSAMDHANWAGLEVLKIDCLSAGIRVSPAALLALGGAEEITVHEYATTGGITFSLEQDVYLNAAFDDWYCDDARAVFDVDDDGCGFVVRHGGITFPVRSVVPLPGYIGKEDEAGYRIDSVAMSHIDRVRLSPIVGCAYDCHFCDLPAERYTRREADRLIRALDVAVQDEALPVRHLLISGGTAGRRDSAWFAECCEAVVRRARNLGLPVDVMMSVHEDGPAIVDRLVDAGVSGFAFNIELFGEAASQFYIRQKHRFARPYFEETVGHAVERLGRDGAVRSLIIPGLEPVEQTVAGIGHIARLGADPVISPFRPARRTRLEEARPVTAHVLTEVLREARAIVRAAGLSLGPSCVPCQHNTLTFPWDRRDHGLPAR